ncbi:MAG: hypothetical protein A4E59_02756 [Syntrophorhabdus sp. PtaB.Bin027]|nr:MAG: hypothetical protein A4E59_02756 [Syntrophorhabdus sp. PtaB.Bin027]
MPGSFKLVGLTKHIYARDTKENAISGHLDFIQVFPPMFTHDLRARMESDPQLQACINNFTPPRYQTTAILR